MNKKHCILCMFCVLVGAVLCACQGRSPEQESAPEKTEQSGWLETPSCSGFCTLSARGCFALSGVLLDKYG